MKIELTKTDKHLDAVRFVLVARAKEKTRYAIPYLKVEPDCIVCTDSHRLHIAYIPHDWEPGLYEVLKCTKTKVVLLSTDDEAKYPKWDVVIPHHSSYATFDLQYAANAIDHVVAALSKQGVTIPYKHLCDAIDTTQRWTVYFGQFDQPIRAIKSMRIFGTKQWERLEAIIMPLKPIDYTVTSKSERRHNKKIA